jgi:hypothetical protein
VSGEGGETAKAGQMKTAPPSANAAPILITGCTIVFRLLEGQRRPSLLRVGLQGGLSPLYRKSRFAVIVAAAAA